MLFVPWRYVEDWSCNACGECCRAYSVVLNFQEWLGIVKSYGVEKTVSGLDKLFIRRRGDGTCIFLYDLPSMRLCALQHMKPKACKLWPFKVLRQPEFGNASEAEYYCGENRFFVYVDSACSGLRYGKPRGEFVSYTLREFVEIALGFRSVQRMSTANIGLPRLRILSKI
jgi:Fe-S-cluster containining protein